VLNNIVHAMQANQEIMKLQANVAEEAERSAAAAQAQQTFQDEVQAQQQVQALLHTTPPPPCQKCGVHLKLVRLCMHCHGDGRVPLLALAALLLPHHCLLRHLSFPHKPFVIMLAASSYD